MNSTRKRISLVPETKVGFLIYFFILIGLFGGLMLTSFVLYPDEYTIITDSVSTLGVMSINPAGWYFFSLSIWIVAIGLIPLYVVVHKKLGIKNKILSFITIIIEILTSSGLFLIGVFQEESEFRKAHLYSSYIGFGGFFLSAILCWFLIGPVLVKTEWNTNKEKKSVLSAFIMEITVLSIAAALFITNIVLAELRIINYRGEPIGWFIGFPFTEWILVLAIFFDKAVFALLLAKTF